MKSNKTVIYDNVDKRSAVRESTKQTAVEGRMSKADRLLMEHLLRD
jgi:hypothetical protein